jgi:hypothetical protein
MMTVATKIYHILAILAFLQSVQNEELSD